MRNKVKLSIIFSARDDGYGDGRPAPGSNSLSPMTFIERLKILIPKEDFGLYIDVDKYNL